MNPIVGTYTYDADGYNISSTMLSSMYLLPIPILLVSKIYESTREFGYTLYE